MTYAGRLDPMAEGLLICLLGDECKEKNQYLGLDKEYEFEILVGVSTDTFDLLGLIQKNGTDVLVKKEKILNVTESMKGKFSQAYPAFSSKPIDGTPRFVHAKEGRVEEETHEVELKDVAFLGERTISSQELFMKIQEATENVNGDFRQTEILESWQEHIQEGAEFQVLKFTVAVSSGFYIRQLVEDLGNKLGIPMTTFWIKRTKIGEHAFADGQ